MARDGLVGLAERRGAGSLFDGSLHGNLLARTPVLSGEHASARHRCHEHAALARSPRSLLDRPLVEYVLSLPQAAKRNPVRPKALLIEALGDLLPQEIISQRKRTFTFPWDNWLRGELGQRVAAGLADWSPALASHIDGAFAQTVWQNFQRGRTTWSRPWSLYVLNEWVKRNLRAEVAGSEGHRSAAVVSAA